MSAPEALSTGLQRAPYWGSFPPKQHMHERRSGLPVRGYNRSCAAESLIAKLHSHGKLTTPRRQNREIRLENEILKENERLHKV
jgi:hypothetical protein